ncbi:BRO-N domain-containing protein [Defluviicoccus vanus]|uniref:BRO-N domain-containing protein n=1 Tax=Defluviicoccus vanus TaxID=111831 RepID=UPI001CBA661D|nr:BRO family protein [Defluviicoccus vanus]
MTTELPKLPKLSKALPRPAADAQQTTLPSGLGYANATDAMNRHCRGVAKRYPIVDALGRMQEARILAEADVLRLIVHSNLPAAEQFERWVFEEVLPTIRKTGGYGKARDPMDVLNDPEGWQRCCWLKTETAP